MIRRTDRAARAARKASARCKHPALRPFSRRLVVMVKEPRAGRVKTRLAREIGTICATAFYRHAAAAVLRRLSCDARWQTWLAVTPDCAAASRCWPSAIPRCAQGSGDLGRRMQSMMQWPGRGPILIVGTDIPAIRASHIASAFKTLARSDAVFGATPDGGYWLVGLDRLRATASPFADVRWSSEHALADTMANLREAVIGNGAVLADVDDAEGWRRARAWSGRTILPAATSSAKS